MIGTDNRNNLQQVADAAPLGTATMEHPEGRLQTRRHARMTMDLCNVQAVPSAPPYLTHVHTCLKEPTANMANAILRRRSTAAVSWRQII
jgi:hypothetical protein